MDNRDLSDVLVAKEPLLDSNIKALIDKFISDLRINKFSSCSLSLAEATLSLITKIVSTASWSTADQLMELIKAEANYMAEVNSTVGNIIRRVLKIIRVEYDENLDGGVSLHKMISTSRQDSDFKKSLPDLKGRILESIAELLLELETSKESIANQCLDHIHANEVILTIGKSKTVESFLKQAYINRRFQVIVAECGEFSEENQEFVNRLARAKIPTTLITDSAIFAMMARVNKVIMGTQSIMANGGLLSITGSYTVALAAKYYAVPLIVLSPIYKLTPVYNLETLNRFSSPRFALMGLTGSLHQRVKSCNPVFEYVPPELVTLFISNVSGHAPSYVYRLLNDYYHRDDYEL